MDQQRIQNVAYQYLCRLEEAKRWMEACLGEELPAPTELEEGLRNGVWLAKLAHHFSPNTTPLRKIYDVDQNRYKAQGLQFRHTDNINHWRNAMAQVGLPTIFHPETTDIYDRKNMPRAVYCIHALSMYLFRLGLAPQIQDLYGKVQFTEEEINNMKLELDKYGIQMPSFSKIGGLLANELSVDQAAVHAAVLAINEAVVQGDVGATALALRNPNAMLERLQGALMAVYQEMLQQARNAKTHSAATGVGVAEPDVLQRHWLRANANIPSCYAVRNIDLTSVQTFLLMPLNGELQQEELYVAVEMLTAVAMVNQALEAEDLRSFCFSLRSATAGLSDIHDDLLHRSGVTHNPPTNTNPAIPSALEGGDPRQVLSALLQPSSGVEDVVPANASRYLHLLTHAQRLKAQVWGVVSSVSRRRGWEEKEDLLVLLQARSRGFLLRQRLSSRLLYLRSQGAAATVIQVLSLSLSLSVSVSIQAGLRMLLARRRYRARLRYFRDHVSATSSPVHSATPPLAVVRKFVHLLETGDGDIMQEAELLHLRQDVVTTIRSNRQLEADLDLMDLKIGLLVRNRLTLQEVVSHCKKLTKKNKEQLAGMMALERSKGLKALHKRCRDRLETYQHLFYLLQTQPLYLAQLIFLMPQTKSTRFMETLVFSLFNYGSDSREAFLLLQLFTAALRYEIRLKVEQPQEVVTGNPTVFKMLVSFYRHARGHNALRQILGSAVKDVLSDGALSIRTDPLEIYKTWINQTETRTGTKSSLPYDVSAEDALSHPEVRRRLDIAIINLKNLTDRVFIAITTNLYKLPYGLRYTAKVLRDALHSKFPEASQEELYKIVGNLIYYRYMNPAIVAPDGFDVLEISAGSTLLPEQRRVLGSIARMLQHAAANKHFQGDSPHIQNLNEYISHTHGRFRKFLQAVCDVPEPEERFNMDEYSEMVILNKPVVYISIGELLNTHKLLLEHQEALGPSPSDPLRVLLGELGGVPSLEELLGKSPSLLQHGWMMQRRAQRDARTPDKMKRNQSLVADGNLSLEEKKRKIVRSLRRLEALGVLTPPDSEAQILQMIAKDIRHQRLYRQRRRADTLRLKQTLSSLQEKSSAHSQQVDYYSQYITSCLDSLTSSGKSSGKKRPSLSYSAARLQEKGVLLEIQDLPATQFKNVMFDIVAGQQTGSFQVKTRFLGVEMEEFPLKYQDLLQLQYEGVAVMKMFDKAKINVNLLIFLLNKKFFKK
uniref:IQ motif containing GTPase activating protein 3 n=1 Tax=Gadus morhua TaxID=8049 RepID=A0A8C5FEA2_GADMO